MHWSSEARHDDCSVQNELSGQSPECARHQPLGPPFPSLSSTPPLLLVVIILPQRLHSRPTTPMGPIHHRHPLFVNPPQVTGFMRVVLPLLKPATFALGEIIVTPKVGIREMGFIMSGEVEVNCHTMSPSGHPYYLSWLTSCQHRVPVNI